MSKERAEIEKRIADLGGEIEARQGQLGESDVALVARLEGELQVLQRRKRRAEGDLAAFNAAQEEKAREAVLERDRAVRTMQRASADLIPVCALIDPDALRNAAAVIGRAHGPNSKLAKAARELAGAFADLKASMHRFAEEQAAG